MRLSSKLVVGTVVLWCGAVLLVSDLAASSEPGIVSTGAAAPCEPTFDNPPNRPQAPTNLRIIPGDNEQSGPFADFEWSPESGAEAAGHP